MVFQRDPLIGGIEFLARHRVVLYALIAIEVAALIIWLSAGPRLRALCAPLAGVLLAGAICSLSLGILIFPLAVLGLVALIGGLGFTPLVTAVVFLRSGIRAIGVARSHLRPRTLAVMAALGFSVTLAIPGLVIWKVDEAINLSIQEILSGDETQFESGVERLGQLGILGDVEGLTALYAEETDLQRREWIAAAYERLTGEDIQTRTRFFVD
ncbi:hypothetical protein JXA47_10825 [Candidatus Sumerlaeota bacterium]|nr:hypothetical protein [Candidatus Sumerlaeota bacterium]